MNILVLLNLSFCRKLLGIGVIHSIDRLHKLFVSRCFSVWILMAAWWRSRIWWLDEAGRTGTSVKIVPTSWVLLVNSRNCRNNGIKQPITTVWHITVWYERSIIQVPFPLVVHGKDWFAAVRRRCTQCWFREDWLWQYWPPHVFDLTNSQWMTTPLLVMILTMWKLWRWISFFWVEKLWRHHFYLMRPDTWIAGKCTK